MNECRIFAARLQVHLGFVMEMNVLAKLKSILMSWFLFNIFVLYQNFYVGAVSASLSFILVWIRDTNTFSLPKCQWLAEVCTHQLDLIFRSVFLNRAKIRPEPDKGNVFNWTFACVISIGENFGSIRLEPVWASFGLGRSPPRRHGSCAPVKKPSLGFKRSRQDELPSKCQQSLGQVVVGPDKKS